MNRRLVRILILVAAALCLIGGAIFLGVAYETDNHMFTAPGVIFILAGACWLFVASKYDGPYGPY
jgi:hypothetical protein